MSEQFLNKGLPTCSQVTSEVEVDVASAGRISTNNAWMFNPTNGNRNNNNTYNSYRVLVGSELVENWQEWSDAEDAAYKNKHHNLDAARIHFHLPELNALAKEVNTGNYKPRPMSVFILSYPVYREVFAPHHLDCIVHHFIAPLFTSVAEGLHTLNGDISHGNRIRHSAQTMAEKIVKDVEYISSFGPCVLMHRDLSGFFININREKAFLKVKENAAKYYNKSDLFYKLEILKIVLLSDPIKDCIIKAPQAMWKYLPKNKSLFYARKGHGLPIGRYPSQVVAGIYLTEVDKKLSDNLLILAEHFVDDYLLITNTSNEAHQAINDIKPILERLDILLHPTKISVLSQQNGLLCCGRVIKNKRIYISNRTVKSCKKVIKKTPPNPSTLQYLCLSLNSFFGIMKYCRAFNIQKQLVKLVLQKFNKWIFFKKKNNQFICTIKSQYTSLYKSLEELENLLNSYEIRKKRQRNYYIS